MKQWDHLEAEKILNDQLSSWWFQGKRLIFDALFQGRISGNALALDVGAGQGLFVNHLFPAGRVVAADDWPACLQRNRQRGGRPVGADAAHLPFHSDRFDYLFALDVLEHLPNDGEAVQEWHRVLRPGGTLVLNVPAFDCLWSAHDVQMGHFRRYDRRKLRNLLETAGFTCRRLTYSNCLLFPFGWLSYRLGLHRASDANPEAHLPLPAPITAAIVLTYKLESLWLRHCGLPFGGSLICEAEKGSPGNG